MNKIGLLFCGFLVATPLFDASAAPVKQKDGKACSSVGTARKDATQDGKKINCLFDTCTYTKCDKIKLSKCKTVIEHSNARDCKIVVSTPSSRLPGGVFTPTRPSGSKLAQTKNRPRFPPIMGRFKKTPVKNAPTTDRTKTRLPPIVGRFKKGRSWYRPKAKTYIMEAEVPRAGKLTGKTAGEGKKGGRGSDLLYKSLQGRPNLDHDWNEMTITNESDLPITIKAR